MDSLPAKKFSFPPAVAAGARVLILGSLPGEVSLARGQYYAFPRNAFWKIAGTLCGFSPEADYAARVAALKRAGVGLWDVVGAGTRPGSLDSAIREVEPNDVPALLAAFPEIRKIVCNGDAAFRLLKRHHPRLFAVPALEILRAPSTSPAAARLSFDEKLARWRDALSDALTPRLRVPADARAARRRSARGRGPRPRRPN